MRCLSKTNQSTRRLLKINQIFRALADDNRLRILCLLKEGTKCVCQMAELLQLPQNLVSHHLKILKDYKVVKSQKRGLKVFYALNQESLLPAINLLDFLTSGDD